MPSRTSPDVPSAANVKLASRATGETVKNGNVARFDNTNIQDGVGDGVDSYKLYLGSGSTSAGWPDQKNWVSFENMFNNYKPQMFAACGNQDGRIPNTDGPEVVGFPSISLATTILLTRLWNHIGSYLGRYSNDFSGNRGRSPFRARHFDAGISRLCPC